MRILHININYPNNQLHQSMIECLNMLNIENKVFAPTYDKTLTTVEKTDYATISECFNKYDRFFYYKKQNKILSSVVNSYDINQFDCIHAYTLFSDGNIAMHLSKKYKIPYVVAIRNTDLNVFLKWMIHLRSLGVAILKDASAIFFLSPSYREQVINKYIPENLKQFIYDKSYIIPNGIDDYYLSNHYKRDARNIKEKILNKHILKCLYVGRIDKNKNTELTLQALNKLNKSGWGCSLTAIGNAIDKRLLYRLNKYDCFKHIEAKPKEELLYYYRSADIFIMPSHTETFGLVYAEAMSQSLPVIYTKGQGFDGQFKSGTVGIPVSDNNYNEIVDAINVISQKYEAFSMNCLNGAGKFNWKTICQKYISIYDKVINNSSFNYD